MFAPENVGTYINSIYNTEKQWMYMNSMELSIYPEALGHSCWSEHTLSGLPRTEAVRTDIGTLVHTSESTFHWDTTWQPLSREDFKQSGRPVQEYGLWYTIKHVFFSEIICLHAVFFLPKIILQILCF